MKVVKWLHRHRQEGCTAVAMDRAAAAGHLKTVNTKNTPSKALFAGWLANCDLSDRHDLILFFYFWLNDVVSIALLANAFGSHVWIVILQWTGSANSSPNLFCCTVYYSPSIHLGCHMYSCSPFWCFVFSISHKYLIRKTGWFVKNSCKNGNPLTSLQQAIRAMQVYIFVHPRVCVVFSFLPHT